MKSPRKLLRKAEKIALAFEYVHDRFAYLPSFRALFRRAGWNIFLGSLIFLIVFSAPSWQPPLMRFTQKGLREIVTALTPEALPLVHNITALVHAQNLSQQQSQSKWQQELAGFHLSLLAGLQEVPNFLEAHPELFAFRASLLASNLRTFQEQAANPLYGIPSQAVALTRSIQNSFSGPDTKFPDRLQSEIALLHTLVNFNAVAIPDLLAPALDREKVLANYIARGKNLEETARRAYFNISAQQQAAANRENSLQVQANAEEQGTLRHLSIYAAGDTAQDFRDFTETKQKVVLAHAESGLYGGLQERFAGEIGLLQVKLNAVDKNRSALIANVVITPVDSIDLGLISPATR